jgi:hypothetical protein
MIPSSSCGFLVTFYIPIAEPPSAAPATNDGTPETVRKIPVWNYQQPEAHPFLTRPLLTCGQPHKKVTAHDQQHDQPLTHSRFPTKLQFCHALFPPFVLVLSCDFMSPPVAWLAPAAKPRRCGGGGGGLRRNQRRPPSCSRSATQERALGHVGAHGVRGGWMPLGSPLPPGHN